MASQLRQILDYFKDQHQPQSLHTVAHELAITPEILGEMIDYWVRKGKMRIVTNQGQECTSCGVRGACPFVMRVPRYYEVVGEADSVDAEPAISAACQAEAGCGCGCSCEQSPMPDAFMPDAFIR